MLFDIKKETSQTPQKLTLFRGDNFFCFLIIKHLNKAFSDRTKFQSRTPVQLDRELLETLSSQRIDLNDDLIYDALICLIGCVCLIEDRDFRPSDSKRNSPDE